MQYYRPLHPERLWWHIVREDGRAWCGHDLSGSPNFTLTTAPPPIDTHICMLCLRAYETAHDNRPFSIREDQSQ